MLLRFDGHSPINPQLKFHNATVKVDRLFGDNDGWHAEFRGYSSWLWRTIPEAVQDAATQAAGTQINVTQIRNAQ